ncbi:MAG: sensor histidine kinase [Dermatophilaceae bacterium]
MSAEREREQAAVIAAQAERARLARDVHDTVAHALVVITMHGEVAQRALSAGRSAQTGDLLTTIGATAREALVETRELVRILAADGVTPAVGVEVLPELVERLRRSGCSIRLDLDEDSSLPADVSHAVYRVVQEAITNALKHGGPSAVVSIRVCRNGPAVEVIVDDDGGGGPRTVPTPGTGHGLRGLRERVEAVGGRFSAGPRATRGFRVWAAIPVVRP